MMVRLVKVKKIAYKGPLDDDAAGGAVLKALQRVGDGHLEKAHKFRNKYGADIVSLAIPHTDGICGRGYQPGSNTGVQPGHNIWAFNIVRSDCVGSYGAFTFPHETGHNMGIRHNPEDATPGASGAYPYSYGHRVPGSYRTIMSYSCTNDGLAPCTRAGYFSNPKVDHMGAATGLKKKRDNVLSLKKDGKTIAAWRACKRC